MASQEERDRIMAEYMAQVQGNDDDDDDEDDEAEFEPGHDDDDEDEDDDGGDDDDDDDDEEFEDEADDYVLMKGTLSRHDGQLIYKGHVLADTFELKSRQHPLHWSLHHPTKTSADESSSPRMRTIPMHGMIGKYSATVDLTITRNDSNGDSMSSKKLVAAVKHDNDEDKDHDGTTMPAKKPPSQTTNGDDDDDGKKMPSKPPMNDGKLPSSLTDGKKAAPTNATVYSVFGKGTDSSGAFEFFGSLHPSDARHHAIPLECQKRQVLKTTIGGAVATAAAAAVSNEDNDYEDDDDADEEVDYNELIALHQEAGLSLADLRKRYHATPDQADQGERKKPKTHDEESDDEYGF